MNGQSNFVAIYFSRAIHRVMGKKMRKVKNIVVLAECWSGTGKAIGFAVQYLMEEQTRLTLLQTYKEPNLPGDILDSIFPMLHKIAMDEITGLKNQIIKEHGISGDLIDKRVEFGDAGKIISKLYPSGECTVLVMGIETGNNSGYKACTEILNSLKNCVIRPIFLVGESLIMIEKSCVILATAKEKNITSDLQNILGIFTGKEELELIRLFPGNKNEGLLRDHKLSVLFPRTASQISSPGTAEEAFFEQVIKRD